MSEVITLAQLQAIMPNSKRMVNKKDPKAGTYAERYLGYLNSFLPQYGITEPLDVAYFLATIAVESCELLYTEEIASGSAYEGRKDLGNTKPGMGKMYKGRGLIQITGYYNYRAYSRDVNFDFYSTLSKAQGLAKPGNAVRSACWYWQKNGLTAIALTDSPQKVRRKVNGGLNGYTQFLQYLARAKRELGCIA